MIPPSPEPPTTWKDQTQLLLIYGWRLKPFGYFLAINFMVFVVLGFMFQIILLGLELGFARLVLIYNPAYQLLGRMLGVQAMPAHLAKPPVWYLLFSVVLLLVPLGIIAAGAVLLFYAGFCNQNLFCILAYTWRR